MIAKSVFPPPILFIFFFFNDTATTEIYTLSLHDALPISRDISKRKELEQQREAFVSLVTHELKNPLTALQGNIQRSEEHTSELQSRLHLVCRLLLEKKKKTTRSLLQPSHSTACTSYC